jgi:hypothetical protein
MTINSEGTQILKIIFATLINIAMAVPGGEAR